jgi:uncharacterized protein YbbC (DUF1343 family)
MLAQRLNRLELPGVRFRAHTFVPMDSKHRGMRCGGVQIHVTDRTRLHPVRTGIHLLAVCRVLSPDRFEFLETSWEGKPPHLDLLAGTARVRQGLLADITPDQIAADWDSVEAAFAHERMPDLIYTAQD